MTNISVTMKSLFNITKSAPLGDYRKMESFPKPEAEEPSTRPKLTKEMLLSSVKEGGLKLQKQKSSDKYDEYYELASLQMFY